MPHDLVLFWEPLWASSKPRVVRCVFALGQLVDASWTDEPTPWAMQTPLISGEDMNIPVHPDLWDQCRVRIGHTYLPLPPGDESVSGFVGMREVPRASACVRLELTNSPVGLVRYEVLLEQGRRVGEAVVDEWSSDQCDTDHEAAVTLHVRMAYRNYVRARAGEISFLEAVLDGGSLEDSRWTHLLMLHGIVQDPAYVESARSLPAMPPDLLWWGEAMAQPENAAAVDAVRWP